MHYQTTSTGCPIDDNQHSITAGERGPILLEDVQLLDKLAHFDGERIPERVVHAKGAGAHGHFILERDLSQWTRAKFLQRKGKKTPVFARFSTVAGEKGSPDTVRDPRGFAVKFYTEEGNFDMTGNNTPIFFVRDPIKFPDFIHSQKKHPQYNARDWDTYWDFLSLVPESIHQVSILFSDRGIPDGYRHMDGYGSHTFKLVDDKGNFNYFKFHFKSNQGIRNLLEEKATEIAGSDPDYATRDLFYSIAKGEFPSWSVYIQLMKPVDALTYRWNPFDVTKVWPHSDYPLIFIGTLKLDRNPENYFAEVEQIAFSPGHVVPGIEPSEDKMLQGRLFSYPDTHRHRLGVNFNLLPINKPISLIKNHFRDGLMQSGDNGGSLPNYEPNSFYQLKVLSPPALPRTTLQQPCVVGRHPVSLSQDDFVQAGMLYQVMSNEQRQIFVDNVARSLSQAKKFIQKRQIANFKRACPVVGGRIEKACLSLSL